MCEGLICKCEFSLFNHYKKCKYSKVLVKKVKPILDLFEIE
jgi:hypothetical protein